MTNFWWRDFSLVFHKFSNLLVQRVGLLSLRFLGHFGQFAFIKLRVIIGFLTLHTNEWVEEVFIAHCIILTCRVYLRHSYRFCQLLSHDRVALDNYD